MTETTSIPLSVDIDRILEVLATQIYQSPLALLRENLQNAFDAVLLRKSLDGNFDARIDVKLTSAEIEICDNGIGMSRDDIEKHFWRAGSSSKNTPEARAAGVVGTFGIGAMANFGIAEELIVESESISNSIRTRSMARRDSLSATENCIQIESLVPIGTPGTTVIAKMYATKPLNVNQAISYLTECVQHITVPVIVNDTLVSQKPLIESVARLSKLWSVTKMLQLGPDLRGKVCVVGDGNGEIWLSVSELNFGKEAVAGQIFLRSGIGNIRTYRSGFSLAATGVSSIYQFGGVADLTILHPTAGREALETSSQQLIQNIVGELENFVSIEFGKHSASDQSTKFLQWVQNHGRFDLCDEVTIRYEPGESIKLKSLRDREYTLYVGQDPKIIEDNVSDESRLVVLARSNPRRACQDGYLRKFSKPTYIDDSPKVKSIKDVKNYSTAESSLVFRVTGILESDYFLKTQVKLAALTHPVPVLIDSSCQPINVFINPDGSTVKTLAQLYQSEFEVFGHMIKDFVRSTIFPKVANLVPSATREGAEAFLKRMRSRREIFEYEMEDLGNLNDIWNDVIDGKITVNEGARRSQVIAQRNVQVVEAARPAAEVIPDLDQVQESEELALGTPMPAISRSDIETDAKLLVISDDQPALNGYRCFLAITDRIFEEKGDFFLQPHATNIVWGGQRALFIFEHHSGEFGLYYDIQAPEIISAESGGGPRRSATIFLKNKVFFPVPPEIQASFIPMQGEKKRLEVRCDVLYTKSGTSEKLT